MRSFEISNGYLPFDVLDPAFVNGQPASAYAWLRTRHPVVWDRRHEFWIVSRYDDIVAISRRPNTFTTTEGTMPKGPNVKLSMLTETGDNHKRLRRIAARGFTPAMVSALEAHMREVARHSVNAVKARGHCDFLHDIAAPLPLLVITEMLGVAPADVPRFQAWSSALIGSSTMAADADRGAALLECISHLSEILRQRRAEPKDDIITKLVAAVDRGVLTSGGSDSADLDSFAEDELMQLMILLVVAGHESTRNMVARSMLALLRHPKELAELRKSTHVPDSAVEELLRWSAPSGSCRTATADSVVRGQSIRSGERVFLLRASANRDPLTFPDPDVLDLTRNPNPHLTFGHGEHYCFGATVARAQIRILLEETLSGLSDLRLAPDTEPTFDTSPLFGVQSMPVTFATAGRAA